MSIHASFSRRTALLGALALFANPAGAVVFTVGNDTNCMHASIQSAINSAASNGAGEDEIRVSNNVYTQQRLQISDQSLILGGGWSSCAATATRISRTVLSGGLISGRPGTNAVLRVSSAGANVQNVTVQGFDLRDGNGGPDGDGAGIDATGTLRLVLQDTDVFDNQASWNGGGISMKGPATGFGGILELHAGVRLRNNQAGNYGGGIYLEKATLRMRADRTEISGNSALHGGGVALNSSFGIGNAGEPEIQFAGTFD